MAAKQMCIECLPYCPPFYFVFMHVDGMVAHVEYIQTKDRGREISETKILSPGKLLWNFLFSSISILMIRGGRGRS